MLREGIDSKASKGNSKGYDEKSVNEILKKLSKISMDSPSEIITSKDFLQISEIIKRLDRAIAVGAVDLGNVAACPCQSVCNCKVQCTNECNNQCTCNRACECQRQCPCQDVSGHTLDERIRPDEWRYVRAYAELASRVGTYNTIIP